MKKVLFSLALLLTGVSAWAQTETTATPEVGKFYYIKGESTTLPYIGKENVSETNKRLKVVAGEADAGIFYFESAGEDGAFYLRCANATTDNVYVYKYQGSDAGFHATEKHKVRFEVPTQTHQWVEKDRLYFRVNNDGYVLNNLNDGEAAGTAGVHNGEYYVVSENTWILIETDAPEGFWKSMLEDLIETTKAKGYTAGEDVGYYSQDQINALETAIATAEATVEIGVVNANDIAKLQAAIDAMEVIMPDPTKYYTITSNSSQDGCTGRKIYVNNTGTMQFEDATTLANVFQFKEAETEGQFYIYCVDRDTYVNSNSPHGEGTKVSASGTETEAKPVVIASQGEGGKVSITPVGGAMLHAQKNGAHVVSYNATGASSGSSWTITEVSSIADMAHNLAIGTTGWATLYLPFNATKPADATIYTISETTTDKATLTQFEGEVLPKNTAVLVKANASTTLAFKYSTENASEIEGANELEGSVFDENVEGNAYILANDAEGVGLYKVILDKNEEGEAVTEDGTHFQNNAFKAYLPASAVPTADNAQVFLGFSFGNSVIENLEGTETAIEGIQGAENADAVVYDLVGRRVKGAQKGLYIVNGKVVVK